MLNDTKTPTCDTTKVPKNFAGQRNEGDWPPSKKPDKFKKGT